jgi:hypothetical protein
VLVVVPRIGLARDHLLHAEREPEVAEAEQRARGGDRPRARGDCEREARGDLQAAPEQQERDRVPAVGQAPERDREEERDDRERRGDEADLERAVAEREQPVRRRGAGDVDGCLRRDRREQREGESAAQPAARRRLACS